MTATKVTALTAATTVAANDLLYIVADPGGSPTSKKITQANFFANVVSNTKFSNTVTFANTVTFPLNVKMGANLENVANAFDIYAPSTLDFISLTYGANAVNGTASYISVAKDGNNANTSPHLFQVSVYTGNTGAPATWNFNGTNGRLTLADNGSIYFPDNTSQNTAFTYSSASFSPQFSTNTGNVLSLSTQTGSYTKIGKLCYFRVFVQFGNSTYADGSGQYQIVLPFPSAATISIRGGTLHNTNTASIFHIGGVLDVATNTTVLPLYYTGSTTDLAWKNTTPVGWQTGNTTHFDISGVYETT
jgi:hypothetical protein